MNDVAHSITRVGKQEDITKSRNIHPELSQTWTTARCHRLLRPIRSRVELLRKESSRVSRISISNDCPKLEPILRKNAEEQDAIDSSGYADQEWGQARKRPRKTYGGRNRSKKETTGKRTSSTHGSKIWNENTTRSHADRWIPGQISIPTPILRRSRSSLCLNEEDTLPEVIEEAAKTERTRRPQARYITKDGDAHYELAESLRRIRNTTEPNIYNLYDGLYNALETLLKATNNDMRQRVKSLFSMCLRAVPRQIQESEAWMASHAEEQGYKSSLEIPDLLAETYEDLESLGTSDRGWRHLKTVVRAHGIQYIGDVVSEGLVDTRFTIALVKLCVHTASLDEAEKLLDSLISSSKFPPPTSAQSRFDENAELLPLVALEEYARYTARETFLYRKLTELYKAGSLPITWLATTQFGTIWTRAFKSLSFQTSNCDALEFMANVLPLMAEFNLGIEKGVDSNRQIQFLATMKTTLNSILTTVSAISILSNELPASILSCVQQEFRRKRADACIYLMRNTFLEHRSCISGTQDGAAGLLAISNLITGIYGSDGNQILDPKFEDGILDILHRAVNMQPEANPRDEMVRIVTFLRSISQCSGRGAANNGFDYLRIMLNRLQHIVSVRPLDGGHILPRIIVDTAYEFARICPDRKHLEYAEALATKLSRPLFISTESESTVAKHHSGGFRWEEGISEWVTATPVATQKARVGLKKCPEYGYDDTDIDTPCRSMLKRRKLAVTPKQVIRVDFCSITPKHRSPYRHRISDLTPGRNLVHKVPDSARGMASCWSSPAISLISDGAFLNPEGIGRQFVAGEQPTTGFQVQEDDSEDELGSSFISPSKGTSERALKEIRNIERSDSIHNCKSKTETISLTRAFVLTDYSEDELGW